MNVAKEIMKKELVYLDLANKEARFYTIEVLSVGYNQMQVITTYGTFNNKGRESIIRFDGKTSYKDASKLAYKKMFEKKAEGFIEAEDLQKWHDAFDDKRFEQQLETLKPKSRKSYPAKKTLSPLAKKPSASLTLYQCGHCKKPIKPDIYNKINEWGRGEGNWDAYEDFVGYCQVLCLDCQIEHDIFKKKC